MATNQVRRRLPGHRGRIHDLVFLPDGKFLVSGSEDTTGLIWDLMNSRRLLRGGKGLSVDALRVCWADLASLDGSTSYDAICKLVAAPNESVPFIARHLGAVAPGSLQAVPKLLADLDHDQFAVREKARQ
jgi:WD40 repeat protein